MIIRPKNWHAFQHYKWRSPPWIKLHRRLLDDFAYQGLPLAAKALAPMLWLIASESPDGTIDAHTDNLAFRLRMKPSEIDAGLKPLIETGFFMRIDVLQAARKHDDSAVQAARLHDATTESEYRAETESTETLASAANAASARVSPSTPPRGDFEGFWGACPRKVGKGAAKKAYAKALSKTSHDLLLAAMQAYGRSRVGEPEQYTVHPATWLNGERWLDQGGKTAPVKFTLSEEEQRAEQENLRKLGLV